MAVSGTKRVKGDALWSVPTLRGVAHRYAFFASIVTAPVAVWVAPTAHSRVAAGIFGASMLALFGVSSVYHGFFWEERTRLWLRRLDHTMIYVLIAGCYTPFGMVLLSTEKGDAVLWALWTIAAVMVPMNLLWARRPKALNAILGSGAGWLTAVTLPDMAAAGGVIIPSLLLLGGVFHTAGAAVYGLKRPNLRPGVFEYHEAFHTLVITGVAVHYFAVIVYVLPYATR
jgi:hemolysin III